MRSTAITVHRLNKATAIEALHEGQVVTLVLAHLRAMAEESFLYLAETLLDDGTAGREIDAAALVDGRLVIVEAKSNVSIPSALSKWYSYLARKTRAWSLVYATTKDAWNAPTVARLDAASESLAGDGISVQVLTRSDLAGPDLTKELGFFERRKLELTVAFTPH